MSFRPSALLMVAASALAACSNASTAPRAPASIAASSADNSGVTTAAANRVRLEIPLSGTSSFARAKGKARWTMQGANRELEVEIENVATGTQVNFFVGGVQYGATQTVDAVRAARIDLSTQRGQAVPGNVKALPVQVMTTAGVLVAGGSF